MSDPDPIPDAAVPLVVDLDGTLCRTDTLHEQLLGLATSPGAALAVPGWLRSGRAEFKARIADRGVLDPALLPLNEAVVAYVETARAEGRPTALVSAADHRQVTAVAEATGLFDEAYGTAEGRNLKGAEKAAFLTAHYGERGFDYMGDSKADLPVWAAARRALTVGAGAGLRQAAEAANPDIAHLDPPAGQLAAMIRALRPHQWSKNLLIFVPMLAAHWIWPLPTVIMAFVAFCLTASAVYVINDLIDLPADRAHPRKRFRPFASGTLSATTGAMMAAGLLIAAVILGLMTNERWFLPTLGAYLVTTFAYSLWLKRKLLVDVVTLAGLYTVRLVAGGVAASVVLSPWILGFSMFIFLALAAVKRQAELTDQMKTGRASAGRAYEPEDLPILRGIAIAAGQSAVLVLALYIASDEVQHLYQRHEILWLICPLVLYWILRMIMTTHRGWMSDDPIVFAATDRVSLLAVALAGAIAVAAR